MNADELMEGDFMDNEDEGNLIEEDINSNNDDMHSKDEKDYIDITPVGFDDDDSEENEEDDNVVEGQNKTLQFEAEKHKKQLQRLADKEAFKKVYGWKFMNCLDLWVKVLCTYTGKDDLRPLAYPMTQIISGVARLVPTARYFPLRLQCTKMLNRLASATGTFIPVTSLLLDMLEFKELNRPPTGGIGKAIDFSTTLKECVFTVVEQLAEHLTQWSYSVSFLELAFIPLVCLRRFNKNTKVDRFRRQVKQLIDQVERNVEYVGRKRDGISFSPKDADSVSSFLQVYFPELRPLKVVSCRVSPPQHSTVGESNDRAVGTLWRHIGTGDLAAVKRPETVNRHFHDSKHFEFMVTQTLTGNYKILEGL